MNIKIQPAKPEPFEVQECWDSRNEKLLCHMVLNDKFADKLSHKAGKAFWRAFIIEHRATGLVMCKLRWNYIDRGRSWTHIIPQAGTKDPMNHLRRSLETVLSQAAIKLGLPETDAISAIENFYPPDDGGDGQKTIDWLVEQDLIEVMKENPND